MMNWPTKNVFSILRTVLVALGLIPMAVGQTLEREAQF